MIQLTYSGDEQQIINERKESLQQTHANLYDKKARGQNFSVGMDCQAN